MDCCFLISKSTMRVWCSLVSLKLAKLITRVQIPAPAYHHSIFLILISFLNKAYAIEYTGAYADNNTYNNAV